MNVQRVLLAVATVALVTVAVVRYSHTNRGWKTIDLFSGRASVSVPAAWEHLRADANEEDWGSEDGLYDLYTNWNRGKASRAVIDRLYKLEYHGDRASIASRSVHLAGGDALVYTVTFSQGGRELRDWDYYFDRAGRTYYLGYSCPRAAASKFQPVVLRSAKSVRFR